MIATGIMWEDYNWLKVWSVGARPELRRWFESSPPYTFHSLTANSGQV